MKRLLIGIFVVSASFCRAVLECPDERPAISGGAEFPVLVASCLCNEDCPYPGIPLGCWDTSRVIDMSFGFFSSGGCQASFNEPLNGWDISSVTDMQYLFGDAKDFNQPLDNWETASVKNMEAMFYGASSFNQSINDWDVSSVETLFYTFLGASSFDQPLDKWNTSSVRNMNGVFGDDDSSTVVPFNHPIEMWDTSRVTTMAYMFRNNIYFNQPLDDWDLSTVFRMERMFRNASSFDQCLSSWPQKTRGIRQGYEGEIVSQANTWLLRSDPSIFLGTACPDDVQEAGRTRPGIGPWCQGPSEGCIYDGDPTDESTFPPTGTPTGFPTLPQLFVDDTDPPTPSPTAACVEDPDATYESGGDSERTCRWLSKKQRKRKRRKKKARKKLKKAKAVTKKNCNKVDNSTGEKIYRICPVTCGRVGVGDCRYAGDGTMIIL